MEITVPYNYKPRDYQLPIFKAYEKGIKRLIWVAHRRAGKDKSALNFMISRMLERVGSYFYVFPEFNQGRRILWDGIDRDGFRFLDHFPKELLAGKPNSTEMKIELRNGSHFQIVGSNEVDRLVGTNPIGIVYSEYSLQDPNAWNYLRPILAENGGWALFIYTPRGKNHGWDLLQSARSDPKWYVSLNNVESTGAISKDILEAERAEMLAQTGDDALYQQEYMLSFDAPQSGSYYARQMQEAIEQGRVCDVPYDSSVKVKTWWDLGVGDSTAIWFTQQVGGEIRIIDYYENMGEGLQHYIDVLNSKGYVYDTHFAPHDIEVKELGTGKSRRELAASMGLPMAVVPNLPIDDGIGYVRHLFARFLFDKQKCARGIECLMNYHKDYDDKHKTYRSYPVHDWCLTGDTKIRTTHGWVDIKDVRAGDYVYGYNGKRIIPCQVTKSGKTGENREVMKVTLDSGEAIKCTSDHLFMTRDGSYKKAKDLNKGDSLMPFYEVRNRKYMQIDLNDGTFADEHRYIYSYFNGYVEQEYHIDHILNDHYNNDPSNLQKINKDDHCSKTFTGKNSEQRKSIDETDYNKKVYSRNERWINCKHCGKEVFLSHKESYCTKECASLRRLERDRLGLTPSRSKEGIERKNKKARETYWAKKRNHKVWKVEACEDRYDVYDLEVPETNNFVAEGVVVHNSSHGADAMRYLAVGMFDEYKGKDMKPMYKVEDFLNMEESEHEYDIMSGI